MIKVKLGVEVLVVGAGAPRQDRYHSGSSGARMKGATDQKRALQPLRGWDTPNIICNHLGT